MKIEREEDIVIPCCNKNRAVALSNDKRFFIVDDKDYDRVKKESWHFHTRNKDDKIGRIRNGKGIYVQRFLKDAKVGDIVKHKNGDAFDNRSCNLEVFKDAR